MVHKLNYKFGNIYEFSILEHNDKLPSLSMIRTYCKKHFNYTDDLYLNILHKPKPCLQCLLDYDGVEETMKPTRKKRTISELIEDFKIKHPDRFMYHDIEYSFTTMKDLVWIKCIEHNHWFQQTPINHLNTNICCPKCKNNYFEQNDT